MKLIISINHDTYDTYDITYDTYDTYDTYELNKVNLKFFKGISAPLIIKIEN